MTLVGLAIVLFGIGLVIYVVRSVGVRSLEGNALMVASVVVLGLGVYLAVQAQVSIGAAASQAQLTNPFPPTQESLAIGQRVYTETGCHLCHGVTGRGDGPAGLALRPPPADFRVHMAAGHTDAQLFTWLSEGMPNTAMPPFMDKLTVEERWHVLNYIRTFAQS
jgi:mono/diheme cytochrome c family protein